MRSWTFWVRDVASRWAVRVALIALTVLIVLIMAQPLLQPDPAYWYFDDFFYYLVPAQRFVETGRFFFHPAITTNGFQPLWMGVIVALLEVTRTPSFLFCGLLNAVIATLFLSTCWEALAFAREARASVPLQLGCLGVVAAVDLRIATAGMEVALAVPLLLRLARRVTSGPLEGRSRRELLGLGFLGSLTLLSRLDAGILLLPLALTLWYVDRIRPRSIGWMLLGLAPFFVYLAADRAIAGSMLPVSGSAKLLRGPRWPNASPLGFMIDDALADPVQAVIGGLLLVVGISDASRQADRRLRSVLLAGFGGVALFYASYCVLTDWHLWFWYKYPYVWGAALACTAIAFRRAEMSRVHAAVALLAAVLALPSTIRVLLPRNTQWVFRTARVLATFVREHPGSYAMGDCAGATAYLTGQPILQTEGLVGDASFVDRIRRRESLRRTLDDFRVDYFVTLDVYPSAGCFDLREPRQGGAQSPALTGRVCASPLLHFEDPFPTYVFRVADIE